MNDVRRYCVYCTGEIKKERDRHGFWIHLSGEYLCKDHLTWALPLPAGVMWISDEQDSYGKNTGFIRQS